MTFAPTLERTCPGQYQAGRSVHKANQMPDCFCGGLSENNLKLERPHPEKSLIIQVGQVYSGPVCWGFIRVDGDCCYCDYCMFAGLG